VNEEHEENYLDVSQKPAKVIWAVRLIYFSLGVELLRACVLTLFGITTTSTPVSVGELIVSMIITFPFTIILTVLVSQGRNWARILLLVMFLLGIFIVIPTLISQFQYHFLMGLFAVIMNFMQGIAIILLFRNESNAWFSSVKKN
jgi:hypothetical protein